MDDVSQIKGVGPVKKIRTLNHHMCIESKI